MSLKSRKYLPDGSLNPKYEKRPSGASGRKKTKFESMRFCAWDCEGVNVGEAENGIQRHKLTSVSWYINDVTHGSLEKDDITTADALNYMVDVAKAYPEHVHVIFCGSYDVNMICRDIPIDRMGEIYECYATKPRTWKGFALAYRDRKEFYCARWEKGGQEFIQDDTGRYIPLYDAYIRLWDVYGFCQSAFLDAVSAWLGDDYADYEIIAQGKNGRAKFAEWDKELVRAYCRAELKALVKICERIRDSLHAVGIHPKRFDGAGAVAAAMLEKNRVKRWNDGARVPDEAYNAAIHAYYGGRIEMLKYGYHNDKVWHYDINSAYPSAMVDAPALVEGHWINLKGQKAVFDWMGKNGWEKDFVLCLVRWDFSGALIGPLPYRSHLQNKVIYPADGIGWVWWPEVNAAMRGAAHNNANGGNYTIEILEAWAFEDSGYKPYSFLAEMYQERRKLKKTGGRENEGKQKVLKLAINAAYGKLAQNLGYNAETGQLPAYHNLLVAGYTTSKTRAELYTATIGQEEDVIALATDGIWSVKELENIEPDSTKALGGWEVDTADGMLMVQAGFYYIRNEGEWRAWSRGFDKIRGEGETKDERRKDYQKKINTQIKMILDAYKKQHRSIYLPCTRFITCRSAAHAEGLRDARCCWYTFGKDAETVSAGLPEGRELSLSPHGTKRAVQLGRKYPHLRMVQTYPAENCTPDTMPDAYPLPWASVYNKTDYEDTAGGVPESIIEQEICALG